MSDYAFRQYVRDEVVAWFGEQKPVFATLIDQLGNAIAPVVNEHVRRNLLVRAGELTPDERARVVELLNEVRRFLLADQLGPAEVAVARMKLKETVANEIATLSILQPPPASS